MYKIINKHGIKEDIVLTAYIKDLVTNYPEFIPINIDTNHKEIWLNNPFVKNIKEDVTVECEKYDNNHKSDRFIALYKDLNEKLDIFFKPKYRGDLYISSNEKIKNETINSYLNDYKKYFVIDITNEEKREISDIKIKEFIDFFSYKKINFIWLKNDDSKLFNCQNILEINMDDISLRDRILLLNSSLGLLCSENNSFYIINALQKHIKSIVIEEKKVTNKISKYVPRKIKSKSSDINDISEFDIIKKFEKTYKNEILNFELPIKEDKKPIKKTEEKKPIKETEEKKPIKETEEKTPIKKNNIEAEDWKKIRHGRERNVGYDLKELRYIQPAPLFFTQDGHNLWLGDIYHNSSLFLICTGPSFANLMNKKWNFMNKECSTKELLDYPGHITMGINNSIKTYRTNLWICVDPPGKFLKSIHLDPKIQKFMPICHADKELYDNNQKIKLDKTPSQCPNVVYYRRNELFNAEQFLFEDTLNWGNNKKYHNDDEKYNGKRSVMLPAMRIAFHLGFKNVYLLGCDMNMNPEKPYHFNQNKSKGGCNSNNKTYENLFTRFEKLKPIFDKNGFNVYNCNPDSALKVFPYKSFQECILESTDEIPNIELEDTEGMYDIRK